MPRVVGATMRLGRDLDLRLQELPADMPGRAEIGGLEQRVRRLRRNLAGLGIGQKIFLLDAELKIDRRT